MKAINSSKLIEYEEIIVYGAGYAGRIFLNLLDKHVFDKAKVIVWDERYADIKSEHGFVVCQPNIEHQNNNENKIVIIALNMNRNKATIDELEERFIKAGYSNIVTSNNVRFDFTDGVFPVKYEHDTVSLYDSNAIIHTVSVIICVHNALTDVIECLKSVWENRSFKYNIIIIDDGSDSDTEDYLEKYSKITGCRLHRNDHALGYTKSANIGLKMTTDEFVVMLNSDTIVTDSWVEKMIQCFEEHPDTGIVSPLSNAATFQSIPEPMENGHWQVNRLPDNINIEMMNLIVASASKRLYPKFPILNGFCFMIRRKVIDTIGYFDSETFPRGYGEEVDFSIRAYSAGFDSRIADDTYIFHKKTKSFTEKEREELNSVSKLFLIEKHGNHYTTLRSQNEHNQELPQIRARIVDAQKKILSKSEILFGKKTGFVLLGPGGNGGTNSVCQEVYGMIKLGFDVSIFNNAIYYYNFLENYPYLIDNVIFYKDESDLLEQSKGFSLLIATHFTTVRLVDAIKNLHPHIRTAYYVQDYEPMFLETEDKLQEKEEATRSYSLIKDNILFAKSNWIINTIKENHGIKVYKVHPSIDTMIYNPYTLISKATRSCISIVSMIRPITTWRNPTDSMQVLYRIKEKYGRKVEVHLFGCSDEELSGINSAITFEYNNHQRLTPWKVAQLLSLSDIFLDMSYYQAFGRTGLEAMCLGCIPILPQEGGVGEYAVDRVNSVIEDSKNVDMVVKRILEILDNPIVLDEMRQNALVTARNYSVLDAAWSELKLFGKLFI